MSCDGNSFDLILHLPFTDKDGNTETSYKFTDIDVMGNQNNEARMNMANMLNNTNYDQTNNIFETDNTLKTSVSDFIKEEKEKYGENNDYFHVSQYSGLPGDTLDDYLKKKDKALETTTSTKEIFQEEAAMPDMYIQALEVIAISNMVTIMLANISYV